MAHSAGGSKKREQTWFSFSIREKWGWIALMFIIGFLSVLASYWIESSIPEQHREEHDMAGFIAEFFGHIGLALWVAIAVALLFDKVYHEQTFLNPLNELYSHLVGLHDVLSTANSKRIKAIYRRDDNRLRDEIIQAISTADKFLYIQGQALHRVLIPDKLGIKAIAKRLQAVKMLDVRICLANTFDVQSASISARSEFENDAAIDMSRGDIKKIFFALDQRVDTHHVRVRLTPHSPTYGLLMTESYLFLEHYTPHDINSTILVFKIVPDPNASSLISYPVSDLEKEDKPKSLHEGYALTFLKAFGDQHTENVSTVLERFIARYEQYPNRTDKMEKTIAEAKRAAQIAERWENQLAA